MRSYFQDSRRDNNSSKVVILFIFLIVMLFLILSGKIPYLSSNNTAQDPSSQHPIDSGSASTTVYEKYPVFQQPIGAYYNYENIDIHWIGETSNSVTLSVGVDGVFNSYTLVVDTEVVVVNNDSWVVKTSDTYVQILDTYYYLYAFRSNERGAVFIGIAKDNNAPEEPDDSYYEEENVN